MVDEDKLEESNKPLQLYFLVKEHAKTSMIFRGRFDPKWAELNKNLRDLVDTEFPDAVVWSPYVRIQDFEAGRKEVSPEVEAAYRKSLSYAYAAVESGDVDLSDL